LDLAVVLTDVGLVLFKDTVGSAGALPSAASLPTVVVDTRSVILLERFFTSSFPLFPKTDNTFESFVTSRASAVTCLN
jgi:hypothetical protein